MYLGMLDGDWTSLLPATTSSRSNQKHHSLAEKSCLQQRQRNNVSDCSYSATLLRISCLDILLLDLHGKLRVFLCHQRRKNKNIVPPVTQSVTPCWDTLGLACFCCSQHIQFRDICAFTVPLPVVLTPEHTWGNGASQSPPLQFIAKTQNNNKTNQLTD